MFKQDLNMNEIAEKPLEDQIRPDGDDLLGVPSDALAQQPHVVDPLSGLTDQSVVSAPLDYVSPTAELSLRLAKTREEVSILRIRLARITEDAAQIVQSRLEWADASAHAQLGMHPWMKLTAAMVGSFLLTKVIRSLPIASIASTLAVAAIKHKVGGRRPG
jgi:hypothetical protein